MRPRGNMFLLRGARVHDRYVNNLNDKINPETVKKSLREVFTIPYPPETFPPYKPRKSFGRDNFPGGKFAGGDNSHVA